MKFAENTVRYAQISAALSRSRFRSRFRLGLKDRQYICDRGWETMRRHAAELVAERLAPAFIPNDGKQTPMRGHPVFIAQHATACCCRGCLEKWHKIPSGRALTAAGNTTTNNHYHGSPISVQATVRSDEDVRVLANRLARLAAGQNYGLR